MNNNNARTLVFLTLVIAVLPVVAQVRVITSGFVNIGTTTDPQADLQVTGNTLITSCPSNICTNSCAYIRGNNGHSTASTPDYTWWYNDLTGLFHPNQDVIGFTTAGTERMRLAANGSLGVNNTSPSSSYKIDVTGSARCTGNWTTSDRLFKTGIEPLSASLDQIMRIKGVQYSFDLTKYPNMGFPSTKVLGFIAQDLAEVLPEAVQVDEFGVHAVNYDMVVPLLVEAVKEQQAQIAELKERLENCCDAFDMGASPSIAPGNTHTEEAHLYQNVPNPYDERTVIACRIPSTVKEARIMVYSAGGELVRTLPVTGRGETQVTFQAGDLRAGAYFYALYTDAHVSPALQMLLTKH